MKHLFTMLLALIAATASAQDFMVDGICYNILSENDRTVEVTESPYGYSGEVVIPAEVTYDGSTYSVTAIGDWAFGDCSALASVSMPSVTTIGDYAFQSCWYLTSVSMPSVTTISDQAFYGCDALTSVSMPSVTTIGDWAFDSCSALTSVSMPSVTTIGDEAFGSCSALTSVSMPSVTTIGDEAFSGCLDLTSVDIPASCTSIGSNPFTQCTALKEIVVDDNNPNYSSADGVLYDKGKTTLLSWPTAEGGINLPLSVRKIGARAFYDCDALTSVSMPSVTTIGKEAFYYCEALTSVHIPASCTSIAGNPFQRCESLEEIVVDENNPNYSSMDGVLYDKYMSTLIV